MMFNLKRLEGTSKMVYYQFPWESSDEILQDLSMQKHLLLKRTSSGKAGKHYGVPYYGAEDNSWYLYWHILPSLTVKPQALETGNIMQHSTEKSMGTWSFCKGAWLKLAAWFDKEKQWRLGVAFFFLLHQKAWETRASSHADFQLQGRDTALLIQLKSCFSKEAGVRASSVPCFWGVIFCLPPPQAASWSSFFQTVSIQCWLVKNSCADTNYSSNFGL